MRSTFCILLLSLLLSACGQMRYIGIETFNPAEITYPPEVKKVLVVNNAVPQPPDSGYKYLLMGMDQDTCRAHADSALYYAGKALSEAIFETDYFQDVLLISETIREDADFLVDKKLTQEEVKALCYETGADAVISFDRLLFDMVKTVTNYADGYTLGIIDIDIYGIVRSYLPSRESPQLTLLIGDSIFWAEEAIDFRVLEELLPDADHALRTAGDYIGRKIYNMFVPFWDRETRWFYTGFGTKWQKATAYAVNEKWENAFEQWKDLYANSSGWKSKAKSAANIALYYELTEDMEKALEWAKKTYELFEKNAGEENKNTQLQAVYRNKIIERIRNDKKLNIQFGEEESDN